MRQQARPKSSKPRPTTQSMHQLMDAGAPDDFGATPARAGHGNGVVIAIVSLLLLGGVGAMVYSVAPDLFQFGPRPAAATVTLPIEPMPDPAALMKRVEPARPANDVVVLEEPGKKPQTTVLGDLKKWTGLGGWNSTGAKKSLSLEGTPEEKARADREARMARNPSAGDDNPRTYNASRVNNSAAGPRFYGEGYYENSRGQIMPQNRSSSSGSHSSEVNTESYKNTDYLRRNEKRETYQKRRDYVKN